jgi:catechol 2,3-dioxygenase-like lactoylglutathione lyase family enzyme
MGRPSLAISLWLCVSILLGSTIGGAEGAVVRLGPIVVTVSNLGRTRSFFECLDFRSVAEGQMSGDAFAHLTGLAHAQARYVTMQLGEDQVMFVQYDHAGRYYPADSLSPDLWFQHFAIIVSDMSQAYARLQHTAFRAISTGGPVTLPPQNGGVAAFKFRDPDGHPLELLHFPAGQGRGVWHQSEDGRVFLGIDHSALGVSDTERSTAFYRDLLGMAVAYHTTNRGSTQERLDGTFNAVVEITGLRPSSTNGPGIELLDYRTPPTGRAAPKTTASNDLQHVELSLTVDDLTGLVDRLRGARTPFVSPDIVDFADGHRAALIRDPDGHALLLQDAAPG